jgi:hypothetical protein
MHGAFILIACALVVSCGGRYEVGNHPGDTAGASGAGDTTSAGATSSGAGGASTTSTGPTTTGAGGTAMPTFDPCVLQSLRSCRTAGCHMPPVSAGLLLDDNVLLRDARALVDRPNHGSDGVTMPGDPNGCAPGAYLLIDSRNPAASLLWLKPTPQGATTTPPCGGKMPIIGTFTADDKRCLQSWIASVLASP